MGTMIMNMSQGNIERDESVTIEDRNEMMSAGWNLELAMTQLVSEDKHKSFPAELANMDIELFLRKMYE